MKHSIRYYLALWFALPFTLSAQSVGNYSVSRSTGITYNSIISTGQSFTSWRSTGSFSEDDNRSDFTDIGFDFWYNGVRYTQFSVSTNGFLDFSNSTDNGGPICDDYGYCNQRFSSSSILTGTWTALAPFYDDMTTGSGVDPLGSSIKHQLDGTAPNRTLTVEWIGMSVYLNITPDINFQVILHESTGVIEYKYGTMNGGTHSYSYTVGINASSISSVPAPSELLTQQTANTNTFSNTVQNNLSQLPASNSQLTFTPLTPDNPTGNLTFSNITNTSMTLNWTDWATNETGYAIYQSTDDSNYFFSTQVAANATSATITGLLPNTTYYWRVIAITEGALSNALTGNATTQPPRLVTSIRSGRWDRNNTWDCACVPGIGDNVLIQNGHTVTLRSANEICNDLTIGQGSSGQLRVGRNGTTAYSLSINGNTTVNTGAAFQVRSNSNTTHTLNIKGNIVNNGTFNMQTDGNSFIAVNFTKIDGNQSVSGNGSITNFYTININKAIKSNVLDISSTTFTCDPDALTITDAGTFQFSSPGTNTFSLFNTTRDLPREGGIIMNSPNSTMTFGAGINLRGSLTLTNGTINVGNANDENINSFGGALIINGGVLNVAGRYFHSNPQQTSNFFMTDGVFNIPTFGSTSSTSAPFTIDVVGSTFDVSGGTIVLERSGGSNLGYINILTTAGTVSGGTLQVGNANTPAGQVMQINTDVQVGNLLINSANATAQLVSNDLNVINDVTVNGGTLDPNGLDMTLGGNWLVTGGTHNMTAGEVLFNGSAQSITSSGSAFNDITLSGTGGKTFQDNLVANGTLTINSNMLLAATGFSATIGGDWVNNATFTRNGETVIFNGVSDQDISGNSSTDFTNITINKSGGLVSVETVVSLAQELDIQTSTTFDADGATGTGAFTLLSNLAEESRVGILPAGAQVTGTLTAQKYLPIDGNKRWRFVSSTVLGATVADLQNEIPISGNFTGSDNGTGGIPSFATGSLAYYDNTIGTAAQTLDDRWVLYPSTDNTVPLTSTGSEGRGYTIWIRDLGAVTYDLTGTLNQGTVDYQPTGNHERWNLIANPYPSSIDWDASSGWTKAGIQGNAIHVWDGTQYLTWNGAIGSLGNGIIAKGTSYFIEGSAASMALVSTEQVKSVTRGTTHRSNQPQPKFLEIVLLDGSNYDKAYIQLEKDATTGKDEYDAGKLFNTTFSLSTLTEEGDRLSINAIGHTTCSTSIPVDIFNASNGHYDLKINHIQTLPATLSAKLTDHYTDTTYPITEDFHIAIELNSDPESKKSGRFEIILNSKSIDTSLVTTGFQNCKQSGATISIESAEKDIEYEIYKGETLMLSAIGNNKDLYIDLGYQMLDTGINEFKVRAKNSFCNLEEDLSPVTIEYVYQPQITLSTDGQTLKTAYQQNLQWYKDDKPIGAPGDTEVQLIGSSTNQYYAAVSNQQCTFTSKIFTITGTDTDSSVLTNVNIYPNPIEDVLNIEVGTDDTFNSLQIVNASGVIVGKYLITSHITQIETGHLKEGIYFMTLLGNGNSQVVKLVK